MRAYDEIVQLLEFSRKNGNGIVARCPAHEDRTPSMSVHHRDGKVLMYCFAGCTTDEILSAMGLDWNALYDEPMEKRPDPVAELIATYRYVKPDRSPYLVVERWREANGKKSFKQRTPEGSYEVRGIKPCLYNLDAVAGFTGTVYVVEGERDVETAGRHGLVATTAPGGARNPWQPYYWEWLKTASSIVVVADDDNVGRKHAKDVANDLVAHGLDVRVVKAKLGKDLTDHLDAHCFAVEDLVEINPNQKRAIGMTYEELQARTFPPISWAIPGILPSGLTLLGGPPKMSKSWLALDVACGVGEGGVALGMLGCEQGDVLYLSLDNDSERRIQQRIARLYGNGVAPKGLPIEFHCEWPTGQDAVTHCREWVNDAPRPRLIVVDTMVRVEPGFDSGDGGSLYSNSTNTLGRWAKLANDSEISILMVHHDKKNVGESEDWLNRFTGSRGLTATAAGLWFLDAKRGEREGQLRVTGRDVETEDIPLRQLGPVWMATDVPASLASNGRQLWAVPDGL